MSTEKLENLTERANPASLDSKNNFLRGVGFILFIARCLYLFKVVLELVVNHSKYSIDFKGGSEVLNFLFFLCLIINQIIIPAIPATLIQLRSILPEKYRLPKKMYENFEYVVFYWMVASFCAMFLSMAMYFYHPGVSAFLIWNIVDGLFTMICIAINDTPGLKSYKNRNLVKNESTTKNIENINYISFD